MLFSLPPQGQGTTRKQREPLRELPTLYLNLSCGIYTFSNMGAYLQAGVSTCRFVPQVSTWGPFSQDRAPGALEGEED